MGYRSKVGIVFNKESLKAEDIQRIKGFNFFEISETESDMLITNDWCKWYEDYDFVQYLEGLVSSLSEEDFIFVRIGEEYSDVDERGQYYSNDFNLGHERKLTYHIPKNETVIHTKKEVHEGFVIDYFKRKDDL